MATADLMLEAQSYRFSPAAREAFRRCLKARTQQPHFAKLRSVRNAPDRTRLRQTVCLFERRTRPLTADDLTTIELEEILASRALKHAGLPAKAAA